jgi:TIR domain
MVYRPRVFISHSAKEPEAKTLCSAIAKRLDPADFEVLWDQNLQTSQSWRAVIDEWIWRCDAAILVLSKAATESRYAAYEAALLRQRWKHTAGQFLLVPIWCPAVDEQVLTGRMGALQLSEIQTGLKLAAWPANAANDPAAFDAVSQ